MKYGISTTKEFDQRYTELPVDIQDLITSSECEKQVEEIGARNGLEVATRETFGLLVFNVLMAIDPIKGLVARIAEQTGVSPEVARKIGEEINENVFRGVRDSLIKIHEIPANEQAEISKVEMHPEHLLARGAPVGFAQPKPVAPIPTLVPTLRPLPVSAPAMTPKFTPAVQQPIRSLRQDIEAGVEAGAIVPPTIFAQKMARPTTLPPQNKIIPASNVGRSDSRGPGTDPYREPIE